jgi:uncharacterized damage-inducible protein DinB
MKRVVLLVAFVALALPAIARAQGTAPAGDPVSAALRGSFDTICRYLNASAEKMPEANYAFKPTPEVMSFGELLGHVANTHFSYCSRVKGEKNPNDGNDIQKKATKAEIQKGLADSIAYCSAVYKEMTDAKALEPLPPPASAPAPPTNMRVDGAAPQASAPPPPPQPKLARLMGNVTHDWEHYGNIVTYLRIKGLVPPSSEPRR